MEHKWIATPSRTKEIMQQFDIKMKKSLGQNFLTETNILDKMIETGKVNKNSTVIEIGPGIGALTEFLAVNAKQVFAFEIDDRFVQILQETLKDYDNVKVYHQDILKVDFSQEEYKALQEAEELIVCANLPYYITTPIILHLISSNLNFDRLVMMMQKEVAERMTAKVGSKSYNSLTIAIQNQMTSQLAFIVPKTVFIPKPNVDSAVLKLERREHPLVDHIEPKAFEEFVRPAFVQRRKTLWNNYKTFLINDTYTINDLENLFAHTNIDGIRRAETLTIKEFADLYDYYHIQISQDL